METNHMKVLITGSDGFIGQSLVSVLKNKNSCQLILCNRQTTDAQLCSYAAECDIVFHLAGVNRPQKEEEFKIENVDFTQRLVDCLKKSFNYPRIIFSSSVQACLTNAYGNSKRQAEELLTNYAKETGASLHVMRLPHVFGKWCRPNYNSVVATFCHNIARNQEIRIHDRDAQIELVYIDDLVNKFIEILENESRGNVVFERIAESYLISVGELADAIYRLKNWDDKSVLPDLRNHFIKKLYSTYLSYLPGEKFKDALIVNEDERGSFTEFIHAESAGQVSVNTIKPGITKGNHWHCTKVEKYLVVKGVALIRLRNIVTDETVECRVSDQKLELVNIPAGYTHNITNIGSDDLVTVMWANEIFDPQYPDTYYEEV